MPTRTHAPIGAPCWTDLMTSNADAARAFYGEIFGWVAEEANPEFGGYFNFQRNGVRVAGCMTSEPGAEITNIWSTYLATDDINKTLEAVGSHGGQVYVPATPVGDLGIMAVTGDPGGAMIGIWQPGEHKGFGVLADHGAPGWFELHTRDYSKVVDYYRDVFRWDTEAVGDSDEFRYTVQKAGDDQCAGIMDSSAFLPEGVPAHWEVYFAVDDTDATLAQITKLGGTVTEPAVDTPYGRLAAANDPNGARFKLVGPNDQMPAR